MSRPIIRWAAVLQIGLMLFTGCHPTQPFFIRQDPSMANYLAQQLDVEYADTQIESLPEATDNYVPFGLHNMPEEFVELTLEDCVSMALQNSKMLRVVGGSNPQTGSVAAALLSAQPGQMPSIYDPALMATTANTQPLAVDSQGTRVNSRGSVRANQVGGSEDALSEFDAQFSALFGYNTTDRPRNVIAGNVFNPQFFQGVDSNAQAAISKKNAGGTITTARFTTVYSRNNIPAPGLGRAVPSDYTTALELQINQPLMRGRGALVNRIPVILGRINEDLAIHEFEINVRNLVQSVEHAYWDLYCGYRSFDAAKRARDSALELWQVLNDRDLVGQGVPAALHQAKAQVFQFEALTHAALVGNRIPGNDPEGLIGREGRLREYIGWGASDGRLIRPVDEPTLARVQFDWASVIGEGLTRNTELRRHKWAIKQDELELISARNQVLPQLDFVTFYRFVGVGDQLASSDRSTLRFPNPGTNAIGELTSGDYQELGARLEYTPQPFGKRRALLNIQNSTQQVKKTQEELREKEVMLVHRLRSTWNDLESTYEAIHIYQNQNAAQQQEIDSYIAQLETSTGNMDAILDQLLRAEERRTRSEQQYYQAICEYNKSIVNMHMLKGSLLDLNNIELQEGAWVDKAYWDAQERARERAGGLYFDYGYTRPGVVSNGPVASGMSTEGNISDGSMPIQPPAAVPAVEDAETIDPPQPEETLDSLMDRPEDMSTRASGGYRQQSVARPAIRQATALEAEGSYYDDSFGQQLRQSPPVVHTSSQMSISDSNSSSANATTGRRGTTARGGSPNWSPR